MNCKTCQASIITCAVVLLLAEIPCRLMAQDDPPGQSLADGQSISGSALTGLTVDEYNGTKLASETKYFSADNVAGSVDSYVYNNDLNNPYGLNDLTFKYVITITPGTLHDYGMVSFANTSANPFDLFSTSVGENNKYDGGTGGDLATSVDEMTAGVIKWTWSPSLTSLYGPGEGAGTSAVLIIETDLTGADYESVDKGFSIIAGTKDSQPEDPYVTAYMPMLDPQPASDAGATIMLLGGALVGVQSLRRRFKV
jgi:hypothetical protein